MPSRRGSSVSSNFMNGCDVITHFCKYTSISIIHFTENGAHVYLTWNMQWYMSHPFSMWFKIQNTNMCHVQLNGKSSESKIIFFSKNSKLKWVFLRQIANLTLITDILAFQLNTTWNINVKIIILQCSNISKNSFKWFYLNPKAYCFKPKPLLWVLSNLDFFVLAKFKQRKSANVNPLAAPNIAKVQLQPIKNKCVFYK